MQPMTTLSQLLPNALYRFRTTTTTTKKNEMKPMRRETFHNNPTKKKHKKNTKIFFKNRHTRANGFLTVGFDRLLFHISGIYSTRLGSIRRRELTQTKFKKGVAKYQFSLPFSCL